MINSDGLSRSYTYRSTGDFLGTYRLTHEASVTGSWTVGQTTIDVIEGTDEMIGWLDLNRNGKCDRGGREAPSNGVRAPVSTFDKDGTFIESNGTHPITDVTNPSPAPGCRVVATRVAGRPVRRRST